jgi:hypothetical protein
LVSAIGTLRVDTWTLCTAYRFVSALIASCGHIALTATCLMVVGLLG